MIQIFLLVIVCFSFTSSRNWSLTFPQNVMFLFLTWLHDRIHLFIIGGVFPNCIRKCFTVISHQMLLLGENCTNSIVRRVYLNLKWLLEVWKCEYMCREEEII